MMEGPVLAFFDERNFEDKATLESHITETLEGMSDQYGIKQKII